MHVLTFINFALTKYEMFSVKTLTILSICRMSANADDFQSLSENISYLVSAKFIKFTKVRMCVLPYKKLDKFPSISNLQHKPNKIWFFHYCTCSKLIYEGTKHDARYDLENILCNETYFPNTPSTFYDWESPYNWSLKNWTGLFIGLVSINPHTFEGPMLSCLNNFTKHNILWLLAVLFTSTKKVLNVYDDTRTLF